MPTFLPRMPSFPNRSCHHTGEFAVRLVAKPEPSELDKRLARELCPRLVDSAVSIYVATRVRTRRKADK